MHINKVKARLKELLPELDEDSFLIYDDFKYNKFLDGQNCIRIADPIYTIDLYWEDDKTNITHISIFGDFECYDVPIEYIFDFKNFGFYNFNTCKKFIQNHPNFPKTVYYDEENDIYVFDNPNGRFIEIKDITKVNIETKVVFVED
jgi:hypothetical protein